MKQMTKEPTLTYHEICGLIDSLPRDDKRQPSLQAEAAKIKAANPNILHYAQIMR